MITGNDQLHALRKADLAVLGGRATYYIFFAELNIWQKLITGNKPCEIKWWNYLRELNGHAIHYNQPIIIQPQFLYFE